MQFMRMRAMSMATGLWLLAACAPSVRADATADARRAIQAAYDKMDKAVARENLDGIFAFYSPDFQQTSEEGIKTRLPQLKRGFREFFAHNQCVNIKSTIYKFSLKNTTATVINHARNSWIFTNRRTKQRSNVVHNIVVKETWVKSGQIWLMKSRKSLSHKMTIDGKPIKSS